MKCLSLLCFWLSLYLLEFLLYEYWCYVIWCIDFMSSLWILLLILQSLLFNVFFLGGRRKFWSYWFFSQPPTLSPVGTFNELHWWLLHSQLLSWICWEPGAYLRLLRKNLHSLWVLRCNFFYFYFSQEIQPHLLSIFQVVLKISGTLMML